jgi:four helix bundle protein
MKDFHKLKVWEKAHQLTLRIYTVTKDFPREEIYGISSQMRRSSASVPTNIAEGCGRESKAETIHFLSISIGSLSELEYQLILAHDLLYLSDNLFLELSGELVETRRMLYAYSRKLKEDIS